MSELETAVADIKARITAAERALVRAEHERDSALRARDNAREELRRDFGVTTAEEAQAKLLQLRTELADIVVALNAALDGTGS